MKTNKLTRLPARLQELGLHVEIYEASKLPDDYLGQLIVKSRQPHVMRYEGDEDAHGRFKDRDAFLEWAKNKRRIFYLLLKDKDIAGVMWFGGRFNDHIDKSYSLTFAIRLYEGFVGVGLSKPFMAVAHEDAQKRLPKGKIWLDFAAENIAAKKAYESFGYNYLGEFDGRVIMGKDFN